MFVRMLHRSGAPRTVRHTKRHFTVEVLEARQLMSLALPQVVSTNVPHGYAQVASQIVNSGNGRVGPKLDVASAAGHNANPKFVPQVISTNVPDGDAQVVSQINNSGNGKVGPK